MAAHPYPPVHAPDPLACPWCGAHATPAPGTLSCERCRRRFTLTAGPALDPRVVLPPPQPPMFKMSIRWSIVVTYRFATLDAGGITSGTLDPVVAIDSIDQVGIAYPDVASIAVWRKVAWTETIVGILVPAPIALFFLWLAVLAAAKAAGVAMVLGIIGLTFGALAAWMIRRGFVVGRRFVRVVGRWNTLTIQVDKRPAFYDQLFRCCGLLPPADP